MKHTVYIGLGSNVNNPLKQVKAAVFELNLNAKINVETVSNIYQSVPLETQSDTKQQADYINAVARIKTCYSPEQLLDALQALEKKHNRVKEYHWGPRSLDLDILLFDDLIVVSERLTIPHIELANRDFVLYPLNDINPELDIPEQGKLKILLLNKEKNNLVFIEKSPLIL